MIRIGMALAVTGLALAGVAQTPVQQMDACNARYGPGSWHWSQDGQSGWCAGVNSAAGAKPAAGQPARPKPVFTPALPPAQATRQPTPAEIEAQREQAEAQQQAQTAGEVQVQLEQQRDAAYTQLKPLGGAGSAPGTAQDNSASFGWKTMSGADAGKLLASAPPRPPQQLDKAWAQLHCAAAILAAAPKLEIAADDIGGNVDQIVTLAGQGLAALQGQNTSGTTCNTSAMPAIEHDPAPEYAQLGQQLITLATDANALEQQQQRLAQLRGGLPASTASATNPPAPPTGDATPAPPPATPAVGTAPVPSAPATGTDPVILKAWQQSQQNSQQQDDSLALVLAMQQQLNEINATKVTTQSDLTAAQNTAQQLLSGSQP